MKLNKRAVALLISLAILVVVTVGVTVAFVFTKSDTVNNTFTPSKVACQVVDKGNHTYTVKNTGDTDVYIRVAVLVNLKNAEDQFYAQAPQFEVDLVDDTKWVFGADGYYYFTEPVAAGVEISEVLSILADPAPTGFTLSVEVVASAIQATSVAVNQWSNGVATATTDGGDLTVTQ